MATYIQKFKDFECRYFWLVEEPTTICRITVNLEDESINHLTFPEHTSDSETVHAEVVALREKQKKVIDLINRKYDPSNSSAVFDLVIRLNNSPCHDLGCQEYIKDWIEDIHERIPKASFRLILHFSNFYLEKDSSCPIDRVIRRQARWLYSLVKLGIVVILCPIIVYKMVRRPYRTNLYKKHRYFKKTGKTLIQHFRTLLKGISNKLQRRKHKKKFRIFKSPGFKSNYIFKSLNSFTSEPQYFSLYPSCEKHLRVLPTEYALKRIITYS